MAKSKREREFAEVEAMASFYKKLTDEQLIMFMNSPTKSPNKVYGRAVKNEIKRRGLIIK